MAKSTVWITNEFIGLLLKAWNEIDEPEALRIDSERRLMVRAYAELMGQTAAGNDAQLFVEDAGQLGVSLYGWDGSALQRLLLEVDQTLRAQAVLWDPNAGPAAPVRAFAETAGQAGVSNYGWNGAALARVLLETGGEQRVSNYGQDEAGNLDAERTDPDRIPWKRDYPAYVQVDPVEIPAVEGILWDPGATAAELYEVEFDVPNNDAGGAAVTVSVGVDIAAAGALAAPEYWMFNEVIPYPGTSGWRGPFLMAGDDDVRGVASVANDASIHWRIRRVDIGA